MRVQSQPVASPMANCRSRDRAGGIHLTPMIEWVAGAACSELSGCASHQYCTTEKYRFHSSVPFTPLRETRLPKRTSKEMNCGGGMRLEVDATAAVEQRFASRRR